MPLNEFNPTDVNPTASAAPLLAAAGPAPASPIAATPQPQPQVTDVNSLPAPGAGATVAPAHQNFLGRIVRNLLGASNVSYTVDPNTGKYVATETKEKPGQLFRNIVAGAILGGASQGGVGFLGNFTHGAAAVQKHQEAQDVLKRQQATQEFQMGLAARKEKSAETEATARVSLYKAQAVAIGAQTAVYRQNLENAFLKGQLTRLQLMGITKENAETGQAQLQTFLQAGITPTFKDIRESDLGKYIHAGVSQGLYPIQTGFVPVDDGKGHYGFEPTYTLINLNQKVKLTKGLLDTFKANKLLMANEPALANLQPGQTMDGLTVAHLIGLNLKYHGQDLKDEATRAEISAREAQAKEFTAEAAKNFAAANKIRLTPNGYQAMKRLTDDLSKFGNDPVKLDAQDQITYYNWLDSVEQTDSTKYKNLMTGQASPPAEASNLAGEITRIQDLKSRLTKIGIPAPPTPLTAYVNQINGMGLTTDAQKLEQINKLVISGKINKQEGVELGKALGLGKSPATSGGLGSFLQKLNPAAPTTPGI
jgi:hypothetical protein